MVGSTDMEYEPNGRDGGGLENGLCKSSPRGIAPPDPFNGTQ